MNYYGMSVFDEWNSVVTILAGMELWVTILAGMELWVTILE